MATRLHQRQRQHSLLQPRSPASSLLLHSESASPLKVRSHFDLLLCYLRFTLLVPMHAQQRPLLTSLRLKKTASALPSACEWRYPSLLLLSL